MGYAAADAGVDATQQNDVTDIQINVMTGGLVPTAKEVRYNVVCLHRFYAHVFLVREKQIQFFEMKPLKCDSMSQV